jgi:hypothetical protein
MGTKLRSVKDYGKGAIMKNQYSKKEHLSLWNTYHSMKKRCLNPNCKRYKDYGARGIKISDEWLCGFDAFAEWATHNGYEEGLTIERKDNNGGYCSENCIWISRSRQSYNKRTSVMVEYRGKIKCLKSWCVELGLHYDITHHRITHGWSSEQAFEIPLQTESESLLSKCKALCVNYGTVRDRIKKLGWSEYDALHTPIMGRGANQFTY